MQVQAQVPLGVRPGQTFTLQTSHGLVPVVVPPGASPGQQVVFTVPAHPAAVVGNPVVHGSVAGSAPPPQLGMAEAGSGASAPKGYRADPLTATADGLPLLVGIPVEKQEQKLSEIRRGGELVRDNAPFPARRTYRDAVWGVLFVALAMAMTVGAVYFGRSLSSDAQVDLSSEDAEWIANTVYAGLAGGVASLGAAMAYVWLASTAPACIVWTSLLFSPVLMIVSGLVFLVAVSAVAGLILIILGMLCLSCVFFCYRPLIPFMIKIVEVVSSVIRIHPCVMAVSLIGSVAGIVWTAICMITFTGAYLEFKNEAEDLTSTAQYVLYFFAVLIFIVGGQVAYYVCHVTYCGVFGRWYFGVDREGGVLGRSLSVALTTSFGSICCGSFLIAAVRALEAVLRKGRSDAQDSGNVVCCVVLCLLECVISCIGDLLEYFSEWAYVQAAVRGTSFVESARITHSLMTCANLLYVVQDLLVNAVVNLGAVLCGLVGGGVGAAVGFAASGADAALSGGIAGLLAGLLAGGAAAGIISSGTKAILVLWAENPAPLEASHPDAHRELEARIYGKLGQ